MGAEGTIRLGSNCGRWDYIYSFIKKFAEDPGCVMPDRGQVAMTSHFLRSYSLALIKTCTTAAKSTRWAAWRRRSRSATTPPPTRRRWKKVRADKLREAGDGHDGTWVAHPELVAIAKEVRSTAKCRSRTRSGAHAPGCGAVAAADLLAVPGGDDHRGRAAAKPQCRDRLYRGVAARHRLRPARQPDGGRRHRRDQPRPAVAGSGTARRSPTAAPRRRMCPSPPAFPSTKRVTIGTRWV